MDQINVLSIKMLHVIQLNLEDQNLPFQPNSGPSACIPPLCDPNTGKPIKVVKGIKCKWFSISKLSERLEKDFVDDIYTYDDLGLA